MKPTPEFFDMLEFFEGLKLSAYVCPAGVVTIGYGSTYYEDGKPVQLGDVITKERAKQLKLNVLNGFIKELKSSLKVAYTDYEFSAMLSLLYNIGGKQFGKSSVLRYFNQGDTNMAAESFLLWNKSNGKVLLGLIRRRDAERLMFLNKDWRLYSES
jgi:lysozyme